MHHTFMHELTPTHNLWLWPKRPPLAFSVAEMSGPKRPRPCGQNVLPLDTHDGTIRQKPYLPKTIVTMNINEC